MDLKSLENVPVSVMNRDASFFAPTLVDLSRRIGEVEILRDYLPVASFLKA